MLQAPGKHYNNFYVKQFENNCCKRVLHLRRRRFVNTPRAFRSIVCIRMRRSVKNRKKHTSFYR